MSREKCARNSPGRPPCPAESASRALASRYKAASRQLLTRDKADAESVFGNAAGWEDGADVHGTIQDASLGLTRIVETPGLGPAKPPALARRLGGGTQGYYNTAGKTLDMPPPPGVSSPDPVPDRGRRKVNDSILSVEMPHVASRYDPDIAAVFGPDGVQEFHGLLHLDPASMTPAQRAKLRQVRDLMANRSANEGFAKMISEEEAVAWFGNPAGAEVGGFVNRAGDVADLNTPNEYFESLRLDYNKTRFTTDRTPGGPIVDVMYQVELPRDAFPDPVIPRHEAFGTTPPYNVDYPCTNTGFTSNRNGRVQPEVYASHVSIPEGTRIRRISKTGGKERTFKELRGGVWIDGSD